MLVRSSSIAVGNISKRWFVAGPVLVTTCKDSSKKINKRSFKKVVHMTTEEKSNVYQADDALQPELRYFTTDVSFTPTSAFKVAEEASVTSLENGSGTKPKSVSSFDGDLCTSNFVGPKDQLPSSASVSELSEDRLPQDFSPLLLHSPLIHSTQDWLKLHASNVMDEHKFQTVVLVADQQTGGRGRGGNQWTSPRGCLMFSAARNVRLPALDRAPLLNYVTCLAVIQGVRLALPSTLRDLDLGIRIKWPNDIYVGGAKIGGILLNTTWRPGGVLHVVTGIGLNVHNSRPTTCLEDLAREALSKARADTATSEGRTAAGPTQTPEATEQSSRGSPSQGRPGEARAASAVGGGPGGDGEAEEEEGQGPAQTVLRRETVLAKIVARLEALLRVFEREGFSSMEPEYLRHWMHSGQRLEFEEDVQEPPSLAEENAAIGGGASAESPPPPPPRRRTSLVIRGLSRSGFLLAEDNTGARYELTPDGNSLDLMRGLIHRKLT